MRFLTLSIALLSLISFSLFTPAHAAINVTIEESQFAEGTMDDCSAKKTDEALLACITGALDVLGNGLTRADIPVVAPEASKTVKKAVSDLKKVKNKGAAANILRRTRTRLRQLASKTSGQAARVYKRVALTFSKALRVLKKRS